MNRIGLAYLVALAEARRFAARYAPFLCAFAYAMFAASVASAAVGSGAVGSGITGVIDYVLAIGGIAAGGFVMYMAVRLMGGIAALGGIVLIAIGLLIFLNPEDLSTVFKRQ